MLSTIVSILIFIVPVAIFLAIQFFSQASRRQGHWPQPKGPKRAEEPDAPRPRQRKARARPLNAGPSCGREVTHFLLTLVGARDSCRACLELRAQSPSEPIDLLAEAERIANEAQE